MAKTPGANAVLNPKAASSRRTPKRAMRAKTNSLSFRAKQFTRRGGRNLWMKLFGKQYAAINN
ncbi:MAG TPA: hypothetical protein VJ420_12785 [Candidatus Udaeobacter sp.]|nr:hypothetical protein [Candidatus Udaeobacter sp.]